MSFEDVRLSLEADDGRLALDVGGVHDPRGERALRQGPSTASRRARPQAARVRVVRARGVRPLHHPAPPPPTAVAPSVPAASPALPA